MLDFLTKKSFHYLQAPIGQLSGARGPTGFVPTTVMRTGLELRGSREVCMDLNLHLLTASHVLFEIKSFYLRNALDSYRKF